MYIWNVYELYLFVPCFWYLHIFFIESNIRTETTNEVANSLFPFFLLPFLFSLCDFTKVEPSEIPYMKQKFSWHIPGEFILENNFCLFLLYSLFLKFTLAISVWLFTLVNSNLHIWEKCFETQALNYYDWVKN